AQVRALAQEMGYVPHAMAAGLRTRETRLVGLVIPGVANPVFARLIMAIEDGAFECGFDLMLAHTLDRPEREEYVIRRLLARRVQGLLVMPVPRIGDAAIYCELARLGLPMIVLGPAPSFCDGFVRVCSDEEVASREVTEHLIALGHRRIAYLAGRSICPSAQARLEGHRRALREAGLESEDGLVIHAGTTVEDGYRAT